MHGWPDHACVGCSMVADQVAHLAHLNARDTTLVFASRAPQADIERVKARMGWEMPWFTMTDDFDADFGVDEWHGTNAFIRDGDRVFRTYFVNSRGDEAMGSTWSYLDITALGRQEDWEDSPEGYPQTPPYEWWNWHDAYGDAGPRTEWKAQIARGLSTWQEFAEEWSVRPDFFSGLLKQLREQARDIELLPQLDEPPALDLMDTVDPGDRHQAPRSEGCRRTRRCAYRRRTSGW